MRDVDETKKSPDQKNDHSDNANKEKRPDNGTEPYKKPLSDRMKERLKQIKEQDSNIYPLY